MARIAGSYLDSEVKLVTAKKMGKKKEFALNSPSSGLGGSGGKSQTVQGSPNRLDENPLSSAVQAGRKEESRADYFRRLKEKYLTK